MAAGNPTAQPFEIIHTWFVADYDNEMVPGWFEDDENDVETYLFETYETMMKWLSETRTNSGTDFVRPRLISKDGYCVSEKIGMCIQVNACYQPIFPAQFPNQSD